MRTEKSIKNAIFSILANIIGMLLGFGLQAVFVRILNDEYLGINGLFSNIFTFMAIGEFGLVNALIYSLYKPIVENDYEKIKILLKYYKKLYNIIAFIIFIISISIMPFLRVIVGEINISESIYFIYLLFVFDIIASYLLTYKRSLLYANQRTYIISIVHILYLLLMNISQVLILVIFHNFILFLIINIIFRILENVIINVIVDRDYVWIKDKTVTELEEHDKKDIIKKVKGLLFYKIGSAVVSTTDNITISVFLGVTTVGLYYNYNIILSAINQLFSQAFNAITSSIGNLLVEEKDKEKHYKVYKRIFFFNSWIYGFSTNLLLVVIVPFIKIWVGSKFVLSNKVLFILLLNFYLQGMRRTYMIFKEAAGVFHEDRYYSLIEAVLNIVFSIIFVNLIGLPGVFLGTIIGCLPVILYDYPILIYKRIFNKNMIMYLKENGIFLIANILFSILIFWICNYIKINNMWIQLICNGILGFIIYNILFILLFNKTEEFKYYLELIGNMIKKFRRKKE